MLHRTLKIIRVYHNISQKELAKKLIISNSYLSELENGKKLINLEVINKYSDFFKIPTSSILLFSENINNEQNKIDKIRFSEPIEF